MVGHDNGRIAITNLNGNIYEIVSTTHHSGEVRAVETIPENGSFLTCGEDNEFHEVCVISKRVLRSGQIYSANYFNLDCESKLSALTSKPKFPSKHNSRFSPQYQGRAIAYSSKNSHVAIATGASSVMIYSYKAFDDLITILQDPSDWCEVIKYSPNEELLAVGSHDCNVYVYMAGQNEEDPYTLNNIVKDRHTAPITALDWSCDSIFIRAID